MQNKNMNLNRKSEIIINFVKHHPQTTYKEIREKTKLHPERFFSSLKEAFEKAGVNPPRSFEKKTIEKRRKIIINLIKNNPQIGIKEILKRTGINPSNIFKNFEDAYKIAGVIYPRKETNKLKKRDKKEREKQIIKMLKENPTITIQEIAKETKTHPYRIFKNFNEIYKKAEVNAPKESKRIIKKRLEVIKYLKENSIATQREINKNCKTHVQTLFNKGIFGAYEKTGIRFPFERLKIYGVGIKKVRESAKKFEDEISIKLSGYGKVNRLVRTKKGVADIIFERENKRYIIEIKNYLNKEVSISQIKQLNKYLEDCNCKIGFLICPKKPKKDRFLIGKNRIRVLVPEELNKISDIIRGV